MKIIMRVAWATVLVVLFCTSLQAQRLGSTSCTTLVSEQDCTKASAAFLISRDNKIFNAVDIVIADDWEFKRQKSVSDQDRTRRFLQNETGLLGPTALLSGSDQDYILIFFEKTPVAHITRIMVSIDAFYKLDIGSSGKLKETKHFDSASAASLAEKINGYVVGWFMGQLAGH